MKQALIAPLFASASERVGLAVGRPLFYIARNYCYDWADDKALLS